MVSYVIFVVPSEGKTIENVYVSIIASILRLVSTSYSQSATLVFVNYMNVLVANVMFIFTELLCP